MDHDRPHSFDGAVARIATRQHGVLTRSQLEKAGISRSVIDRRLAGPHFRRLFRGVYLVGPIMAPRAREMAAVLVSGAGATVCKGSAAGLHGALPPQRPGTPVHVFVRAQRRQRPGIRAWRVTTLEPEEVMRVEGIPVTTPARTLLDLAATAPRRVLERAIARSERERLVNRAELMRLLSERPGRRGTPLLRAVLEASAEPAFTNSEAEERFLELVRSAGIGAPEVNAPLADFEVDFLWRAERLVVEVDGFRYHSSRQAFESDRRRDADLESRGFRVMRVTWRQLSEERDRVLARVAVALARGQAQSAE